MRKGTQLLLVPCTVSYKSLHLCVSSWKSFNWCLGIFMAAEDLQTKGLMLIHQQGIQSEEAWVQREANWAGRSLSHEPWVGMTGGLVIAESLGECGCVKGTQTDSCSAQHLHWAQSNAWSFRKQCFLPSWQLLSSGVCSPNVTQAELGWTRLLNHVAASGLFFLQISGVRASSCNSVLTLAKWGYVPRLEPGK